MHMITIDISKITIDIFQIEWRISTEFIKNFYVDMFNIFDLDQLTLVFK